LKLCKSCQWKWFAKLHYYIVSQRYYAFTEHSGLSPAHYLIVHHSSLLALYSVATNAFTKHPAPAHYLIVHVHHSSLLALYFCGLVATNAGARGKGTIHTQRCRAFTGYPGLSPVSQGSYKSPEYTNTSPYTSRSRADVSTSAMQWKHYWSFVFAVEAALHSSPHGNIAISVCGCYPVEVKMDHRSWVAVSHCGLVEGRGGRVRRDQYIHV